MTEDINILNKNELTSIKLNYIYFNYIIIRFKEVYPNKIKWIALLFYAINKE